MAIFQLDQLRPVCHPSVWVADNAQVIGDVHLAADCSVWFGAVLRGDRAPITLGRGSNIQDNSVLHVDHGEPLQLGEHVTVGHQVMLHACTIGDYALIGMQSVVLNGAQIGRYCLVGAGSLVTEGKVFPEGSLILGRPARVVRALLPEEIQGLARSAEHYIANAQRYARGLQRVVD